GGLSFMTLFTFFAVLSGRKISLKERETMQTTVSAHKLGGIGDFTIFILKHVAIVEAIGAVLLMPVFIPMFGLRGIWMSFFHSISAFCNAGFDLMGTAAAPYQSLTSLSGNLYFNVVIMLLIIVGGIGFLTWDDILTHKTKFQFYKMQSKVILTTSAILIVIPAFLFFNLEYANLPFVERLSCSLFQSVTTRTAGFNTTDYNMLSGAGRAMMIPLMLVGGSPGSTAGGLKTTTLAVLVLNAIATMKQKEDAEVFGRRIEKGTASNASALLMIYVTLFVGAAMIISRLEGVPMDACLFETASAVGTVGLSLGLTPTLGGVSRVIIMLLMFIGRLGGLTLIYAVSRGVPKKLSKLPVDKITVG
ncbi:MAG: Trk family potassium uptake protein, partial [Clostridia bacterium]|nr:Trk family potassium uptake protein [Clostridia bacterium]